MTTVSITPNGPFSLAASTRFLEGFAPAGYQGQPAQAPLRLAFPVEGDWLTVGASVEQADDGTVHARITGDAEPDATRAQLARILSLDVDGSDFPRVAAADPVAAHLVARYPELRPVCFFSPYEAAAWAVIGQRIRIVQAARVKAVIAERYGQRLCVADCAMSAFPAPQVLRAVDHIPGLPEIKTSRLRAIADAALAGHLDAEKLRALPTADALAQLTALPGIGPFSAELVLIRGAGHPDHFPSHERRLHDSMVKAYGLADADPAHLAEIAAQWTPYRSWMALLFRTHREEATGEITRLPRRSAASGRNGPPRSTG